MLGGNVNAVVVAGTLGAFVIRPIVAAAAGMGDISFEPDGQRVAVDADLRRCAWPGYARPPFTYGAFGHYGLTRIGPV